jgi:hypothetical protein
MVKSRSLLLALCVMFLFVAFAGISSASRTYRVGQEWVKIWINQDGTIDLFYNISITLDSGDNITYVLVGQPNHDFKRGNATDQFNRTLTTLDASTGNDFKVRVNLFSPLTPGHTIWFTFTTNVARMIREDTKNPGNVGMQFIPTWFPDASVLDLSVSIVVPLGVNASIVKTNVNWNNTLPEPDGRMSVYWQRQNLLPDQRYTFGVSYPKSFQQKYETEPTGIAAFLQQYGLLLLVVGVIILGIVVFIILIRKRPYLAPTISIESLGIRRGLTAVEASYLLDMKPTMLVTEILYSLLHKRAVWTESTTPSLKLKILKPFEKKTGTREIPLRYYEIDFLNAIKEDGTLEEEKLAQTVMFLRDTVEEKMRGFCRRDTITYYKSIVSKAWEQVEQAGAPELASKAYDEQLLWLLLDPNYQTRTQTAFHDRPFEPNPLWLWFWFGYQHYHPHPTYTPSVETPSQAARPPTIPGSDFANNIAAAVTNTSNNIVANLEKFSNSILPTPAGAEASHEPAHQGATCVCACATCACACACVSCACACAGGGVG